MVYQLTEVVRTPQSSDGGAGVGAAGVSMNSKSSEDSDCVFAIVDLGAVCRGNKVPGQKAAKSHWHDVARVPDLQSISQVRPPISRPL